MGAPSPSPDDSGVVPIGSVLDGRYRVDVAPRHGRDGPRLQGRAHRHRPRRSRSRSCTRDLGGNKEASQRFQREALASGRLDHPNIVGVSDFGELDDGSLLPRHGGARGRVARRAPRAREAASRGPRRSTIMRGVLAGLRHAHEQGRRPSRHQARQHLPRAQGRRDSSSRSSTSASRSSTRATPTIRRRRARASPSARRRTCRPSRRSAARSRRRAISTRRASCSTRCSPADAPFEDEDPLAMLDRARQSRSAAVRRGRARSRSCPPGLEERDPARARRRSRRSASRSAIDYIATLDDGRCATARLRHRAARVARRIRRHRTRSATPPPGSHRRCRQPAATPMPFATDPSWPRRTASFTPMPFATSSLPQPRGLARRRQRADPAQVDRDRSAIVAGRR